MNAVRDEAGAPWVWEYSTLDGATVYDTTVFWDLPALKKAVDDSFADYTWEEVERREIRGTSVLVNRNGRYVDTGHWVYRKPQGSQPARRKLTVGEAIIALVPGAEGAGIKP